MKPRVRINLCAARPQGEESGASLRGAGRKTRENKLCFKAVYPGGFVPGSKVYPIKDFSCWFISFLHLSPLIWHMTCISSKQKQSAEPSVDPTDLCGDKCLSAFEQSRVFRPETLINCSVWNVLQQTNKRALWSTICWFAFFKIFSSYFEGFLRSLC